MTVPSDPFMLDAATLAALLDPAAPAIPELEAARANVAALRDQPQARILLAQSEPLLAQLAAIPITPYTAYRRFVRDGDRKQYERPYFLKRQLLAAAALRLFLGIEAGAPAPLLNLVHDYLWNICEESNWVVPAHERNRIDLFAAETGFMLADTLTLLGDTLHAEVRARVRQEIERRIFEPYLRFHAAENWYAGHNNWNGVCNSSVAATFLLLEPEPGRVAQGVAIALRGLRTFLETAFEADGGSNEGVAYWHYGLFNLVALSELLRARTHGAVDLLASARIRAIAAYPAAMHLSGAHFASFSDCDETTAFHPGFIARLSERTGEHSLHNLLAEGGTLQHDWRLTMPLRSLLWWDGARLPAPTPSDALLPSCGVARLVGQAANGASLVLAIKAGHNAENHNQNDLGSFMVHADGENLLTDPGRGLYTRFYFGPQRYENIFANSYGHSVPRVAGQLQAPGREYAGELLAVERERGTRRAVLELARAYPVEGLGSLRRVLALADDGTLELSDTFAFAGEPGSVEEAFVTWFAVELQGSQATIRGERNSLQLTIVQPAGAIFQLEELEQQSRENARDGVLKRISIALAAGEAASVRVRMEVL